MTPVNPTDAQVQVNSYVDMHYKDPNPIFSVVIDANMLRDFLNNARPNSSGQTGTQVTQLKFIFAHDLAYAQGLAAGTILPTAPEQLSFVLGGYDNMGNYILDSNDMIFDQLNPCPVVCPVPVGSNAACSYLKLSDGDPCHP